METDNRVFGLILGGLAPGLSTTLAGAAEGATVQAGLGVTWLAATGLLYGATAYATRRDGHLNVGPVYVHQHPRLLKAYLMLTGLHVADCGCIYATGTLARHAHKPGHKVMESKEYWQERYNGARVSYHLYEEQTVRCKECGRIRIEHEAVDRWSADKVKHEAWRDDLDRAPDDGREIVRAEA